MSFYTSSDLNVLTCSTACSMLNISYFISIGAVRRIELGELSLPGYFSSWSALAASRTFSMASEPLVEPENGGWAYLKIGYLKSVE